MRGTTWLREPLLHFLAIGLALFLYFDVLGRGERGLRSHRDHVGSDRSARRGLRAHAAAAADHGRAQRARRRLRARGNRGARGAGDRTRSRRHHRSTPAAAEARVPGRGFGGCRAADRRRAGGLARRAPGRFSDRSSHRVSADLLEPRAAPAIRSRTTPSRCSRRSRRGLGRHRRHGRCHLAASRAAASARSEVAREFGEEFAERCSASSRAAGSARSNRPTGCTSSSFVDEPGVCPSARRGSSRRRARAAGRASQQQVDALYERLLSRYDVVIERKEDAAGVAEPSTR